LKLVSEKNKSEIKAVGLISGGLDSLLAAKLIQNQGINVVGVCFESPFFDAKGAKKSVKPLGIPLIVIDISAEYIEMIKNPRYGFGRNMNPCIDCHGLMVRQAGELMKEIGASFVFTGEVLGQRPMSQRKDALRCVEKLSGIDGYILRPLSAKLLPPTIPEQNGVVDREQLLDIQGRTRRRQQELAERWGIEIYQSPGGGCMLTKEGFSRKLKELMEKEPDFGVRDAELLKWGRHFRLPLQTKLIIGRNRFDNQRILSLRTDTDTILKTSNYPGPIALIPMKEKEIPQEDLFLAANIVASYSDCPEGQSCWVMVSAEEDSRRVRAVKKKVAEYREYLI